MKKAILTLGIVLASVISAQAQDQDAKASPNNEVNTERTQAILKQKKEEYLRRKEASDKKMEVAMEGSEAKRKQKVVPVLETKVEKKKNVSQQELDKQKKEKKKTDN